MIGVSNKRLDRIRRQIGRWLDENFVPTLTAAKEIVSTFAKIVDQNSLERPVPM